MANLPNEDVPHAWDDFRQRVNNMAASQPFLTIPAPMALRMLVEHEGDLDSMERACAVVEVAAAERSAVTLHMKWRFVGKSRCSQGHSVSEVLDRAKPGDRHCLYCEEQAALHERLMLAVSELTSPETLAESRRVESVLDFKVTVCSECLQASCWLGEFYCEQHREASTVIKTVRELHALGPLEDAGWWFKSADTGTVNYQFLEAYRSAVKTSTDPQEK